MNKISFVSWFPDKPSYGKCETCGGKTCSMKIEEGEFSGRYFKHAPVLCDKCFSNIEIREKESLKKYREKNFMYIAHKQGMPKRFLEVSSNDFNKKQLDFLMEISNGMRKNKQYLIYGSAGKGKSRAAAFVFCHLIHQATTVDEREFSWVNFSDLLLDLQRWEDSEYSILKEKCFSPKHFVLEFGDTQSEGTKSSGFFSEYSKKIFQLIVDHRWKNRLPVLYVTAFGKKSNVNQELLLRFDQSTVGRLLEDTQKLHWGVDSKDFRLVKSGQRSLWEV